MNRFQEANRVKLEPLLPLSTPFVINVDPSSACNFKCKFCYQSSDRMIKKGIMDWQLYRKVITDISNFDKKLKTLRLYAFGEPLVNPKFSDMVQFARDTNIAEKIDTTTNGSLLNPKRNLEIIDAGIDRINISVNGVDDIQYSNFCNYKLDFKKYVDNITHLFENRKQCVIFIKINGDAISEEDKSKFLEIFTPISDGINIEHVMNCWYDFDLKEVNTEVGIYGQPLKEVEVCSYIFYSFCVQFDGMVSACFLDWNRRLIMGDVKTTPLLELWNSEYMQTMRIGMLKRLRKNITICKNCNQLIAGQPEDLDNYAENILNRL